MLVVCGGLCVVVGGVEEVAFSPEVSGWVGVGCGGLCVKVGGGDLQPVTHPAHPSPFHDHHHRLLLTRAFFPAGCPLSYPTHPHPCPCNTAGAQPDCVSCAGGATPLICCTGS